MTAVHAKPGRPAGIYIHIPFCSKLCPYCDFAVSVRRDIPHAAYADAIIAEARDRMARGEYDGRDFSTVYLGGGTPTLLQVRQVDRIASFFRDEVGVDAGEWTFEANPVDITPELASAWRAMGFTRVSVGVQSFDDAYLGRLGRQHDGDGARRALDVAFGEGFDVSFDLIFAGPGHSMKVWESDLAVLSELPRVDHVSAYHLTVEPNTVFARRASAGKLDLPEDDVAVEMLGRLREVCASRGVEQYEVSSYAAPGKRSRHNSHYWTGNEYAGLGVGAHGLVIEGNVSRTMNSRRLKDYLGSPASVRELEVVDPLVHLGERAFTGLRSAHGLNLRQLHEQFDDAIDPAVWGRLESALERVEAAGWAASNDGVVAPTPAGFLFADLAGEWVYDAVAG